MQCTIVQCVSCCCNDNSIGKMLIVSSPWCICFQACCQYMLFDDKSCTVATVVLACAGGYRANMLIFAAWWTASSHVASACVLCIITCMCWVTISLTVQSLYLPDRTTSSISAVSGSAAADFTAVCLCNVICLGCAASDCLITWTGSPAGLVLGLGEFVFCAKISSAKKYFCSKGAHCALSTLYDDNVGKHNAMARHTIKSDRINAAARYYMLGCSRQVL